MAFSIKGFEKYFGKSLDATVIYHLFTVESRYNEPPGEMENSSLYQEIVISKNCKITFFS